MALEIMDITSDPPLTFAASGSSGEPMRTSTFSGACRLEKTSTKLFSRAAPTQLGFYVPGAGPFPPSYTLTAWVELTLASVEIVGNNQGQRRRYGVDAGQVQLVGDEQRTSAQWPYICFTAYGGSSMLLRYRLTVMQPEP